MRDEGLATSHVHSWGIRSVRDPFVVTSRAPAHNAHIQTRVGVFEWHDDAAARSSAGVMQFSVESAPPCACGRCCCRWALVPTKRRRSAPRTAGRLCSAPHPAATEWRCVRLRRGSARRSCGVGDARSRLALSLEALRLRHTLALRAAWAHAPPTGWTHQQADLPLGRRGRLCCHTSPGPGVSWYCRRLDAAGHRRHISCQRRATCCYQYVYLNMVRLESASLAAGRLSMPTAQLEVVLLCGTGESDATPCPPAAERQTWLNTPA